MFNCPDIFVDSSYVSYFNIFSTWKWYKKEYIFDDNDYRLNGDFDPMEDPEYEKMLEYKFNKSLFGVINQSVAFLDRSKIYFILDCPKKDIWRNHYYPLYKGKRYNKKYEFSLTESFNFLINEVINNHCDNHNSKVLDIDNAEADDIIAHIILNKYKTKGNKNNIVIASDRDLTQLCPYTKQFDLHQNEITIESSYIKDKVQDLVEDKENIGDFLLYKALQGDKSDNITGFLPRTGPKTAIKYINNKEELKKVCKENKEALKLLNRNLKIMNLSKIPDKIKTDIWDLWETKK